MAKPVAAPSPVAGPEAAGVQGGESVAAPSSGQAAATPAALASLLGRCRDVSEFELLDELGKGQFGIVRRAKDRKSPPAAAAAPIAVKELVFDFTKEGFPVEALREISLLSSLTHPNIVTVREVATNEDLTKWYMVMDVVEYDLTTLILGAKEMPFSEAQVKDLMRQLFSALACVHGAWAMHRDLKPDNILVSSRGVLKLCDFGLARRFAPTQKSRTTEGRGDVEAASESSGVVEGLGELDGDTEGEDVDSEAVASASFLEPNRRVAGEEEEDSPTDLGPSHTPRVVSGHYRPPEVLLRATNYDCSIDLWSTGCIFAELVARRILFEGSSENDQLHRIFHCLGEPSSPAELWPEYEDLRRKCGFRYRPTAVAVKKAPESAGKEASSSSAGLGTPASPREWHEDPNERAQRFERLRARFPKEGYDPRHIHADTCKPCSLSDSGFLLLSECLECNPGRRITAAKALESPWFSEEPRRERMDEAVIGIIKRAAEKVKREKQRQQQQLANTLQPPRFPLPPTVQSPRTPLHGAPGFPGFGFPILGARHPIPGLPPPFAQHHPLHSMQHNAMSRLHTPPHNAIAQAQQQAIALAQARAQAMAAGGSSGNGTLVSSPSSPTAGGRQARGVGGAR